MGKSKREAWLNYYLGECHFNATEAARQAGYKYPNTQGPRIKKELQSEIDARLDEMAMSANEVLTRLGEQAGASLEDFIQVVELDGKGRSTAFVSLSKAAELGKLHLIKKLTYHNGGGYTIELHDAQSALQHLDRYHGGDAGKAIPDQVEVKIREIVVEHLPDEPLED